MNEPRSSHVLVNVEPSLWVVLKNLVSREQTTMSSYLRALLIDDLNKKGILDDAGLKRLTR
jgi:hypothetical protein